MAAASSNKFAATCSLLRQYMREHQQQLEIGITGTFSESMATAQIEMAEAADGRTLQLFPVPYNASKPSHEKQDTQTLTIFYQGRVLEFEGFPADKVKELMVFAASMVSSPVQENKACTLPEMEVTTEQSTVLDLPITRKVSLQRFLQKRKHRASTTESYLKGLTSQPPLEKDVTAAGNELKYDLDTTNWLRL